MTRITHIDIARGLGILLVVAGHNWIFLSSKGELYRIIYSFHIPLFFILAGVVFDSNKSFIQTINEKFISLLVPYFLTGFTALFFSIMLSGELSSAKEEFVGLIYGTGPHLRWVNLWFLPNLFIVSNFCWAWLRLHKLYYIGYYLQGLILIAFIFIGWLTIRMFWGMEFAWEDKALKVNGLPFSADIIFITSAYFLIGYIFRNGIKEPKNNLFIFILVFVTFIAAHAISNYTTDINLRRYDAPIIATILAITGSAIVVMLSKSISSIGIIGKPLAYLGRNSLVLLLFHSFFQDTFFVILSEYSKRFFYIGVATFLASLAGSVIVIEVINRFKAFQYIYRTSKYNSKK